MIRDITIGQYYPSGSIIHRLDPRVKLICTIAFMISMFMFDDMINYIVATIFLFGVIKISKVPLKYILKGLKPIILLLMISVLFNLFLTPGEKILIDIKFIKITQEGLINAIFIAIRLIYIILGSSMMTFTTTPNNLTDGMEKLFSPLKIVRFPIHEISMMMLIALRFIPILLEETDKIMKAQMARGADFESGGIIKRLKSYIPLLIPLFISAFRRANDLAMAMEARCYNGGIGRTKMKPLKYSTIDLGAYGVFIMYVVVIILFNYLQITKILFS